MTHELRDRAAALLDVLGYRTKADQTQQPRDDARRYRAALASRRFPELELEWAWADNLDTRPSIGGIPTVFGALERWWPSSTPRPPSTLILASRAGPGKTVGAIWLASHRGGQFMTAAEVGELELAAEGRLRTLIDIPLLVIDDLGDETQIGPTPERMRRLLKDRHSAKRTTLVTTNLTPPEFVGRYGDHVDDRVRSTGGCVSIRGRSRRRQGAQPRLEGIGRACRIADLVERVDAMTGARAPELHEAALTELRQMLPVSDRAVDEALEARRAWAGEQGRGE